MCTGDVDPMINHNRVECNMRKFYSEKLWLTSCTIVKICKVLKFQNQVCPISKTGVPMAPEIFMCLFQIGDCDGYQQKVSNGQLNFNIPLTGYSLTIILGH